MRRLCRWCLWAEWPLCWSAWIIGAGGVERIVEIDLNAEEQAMFDNSVEAVKALNGVVAGLE